VPIVEYLDRREAVNKMPDGPAKTAALEELRAPVNGVPRFASRVYVGRDTSKAAVVNLGDRMGRTRLRLVVDSVNVARIEFLNENGQVVRSVGEK